MLRTDCAREALAVETDNRLSCEDCPMQRAVHYLMANRSMANRSMANRSEGHIMLCFIVGVFVGAYLGMIAISVLYVVREDNLENS
jgi:hypothetical protein